MNTPAQIDALVQQWLQSARSGTQIPITEVCKDFPALALEVEKRIHELIEARDRRESQTLAQAEPVEDEDAPVYPTSLGGFKLGRILGEGGMGRVYEAEDIGLRRKIAIKVMRPDIAAKRELRERFLREARAVAALEYDHIVTIHQVGEDQNIPYLVMPLLKGEPLDVRLNREGALPVNEVVRIAREIAEGLATAHDHGMVHRDIKPANIWLESQHRAGAEKPSKVKILDFGLARRSENDHELTQSGVVMGTPAYMAPEQAVGEVVDSRADLFSLGCVIHHMTTGARPFTGASTFAIMTAVLNHTPAPLHLINPSVPLSFSTLTDRLLSKSRNQRPATTWELVTELRRIEDEMRGETQIPTGLRVMLVHNSTPLVADPWSDIDIPPTPPAELPEFVPVDPPTSRRGKVVGIAIVGIMVLAAGIFMATRGTVAPESTAEHNVVQVPKTKPEPKREMRASNEVPLLSPFEFKPVPIGMSPFDDLNPMFIPVKEKFDWQPKELVAVIGEHERRVFRDADVLAISRDGKWAAATSSDFGTVPGDHLCIYDLTTFQTIARVAPPTGDPLSDTSLMFSPDSRCVWISSSKGLAIYRFQDVQPNYHRFDGGALIAPRLLCCGCRMS